MTKVLILLTMALISTACIKTADQVQRERRFENISEQMKDSQGLMAEAVTQMKDMQTQLDRLTGRIEELEHKQSKVKPDQVSKMSESLVLMQSQQEASHTQLTQIQSELKEQRAFLEKVTASIQALSKEEQKPAAKTQKKSVKEELNAALELVKNNKYAEARTQLEGIMNSPELSPGEQNKLMHGLGRVEFFTKNYDKALVYFSKIFAKYPKASLAPSSLLFIGKSLDKLGKKDEAKEAFSQVVESYPTSKEAEEAKKQI